MILYTNGCSWTATGGLDHLYKDEITGYIHNDLRLQIAWPHHLGKLMNAEKVINLATGCGSNQRTVRKTYEWLRQLSKNDHKNVVAVIQIAEWSRFEMLRPEICHERTYTNQPGDWINVKADCVTLDVFEQNDYNFVESYDEVLKKGQDRFKHSNLQEDFYRTISYLYALKGLFDSYNIKDFYIWHQGHHWNEWPKDHLDALYDNFKVLDKNYDWDEFYESEEFWQYDRIGNGDTHPSVEGNKQLAQIIYDRMIKAGYKNK